MSYQIIYLQEEDYLIAEVKGDRERNTEAQYALEALAQISEACKKHKLSKVVAVWNVKGAMSPDQALILISNLKKYKWSKDFVTASVHPYKDNFESHQYTVKVAKTLNWNIHFFQSIQDAKMWLEKLALLIFWQISFSENHFTNPQTQTRRQNPLCQAV